VVFDIFFNCHQSPKRLLHWSVSIFSGLAALPEPLDQPFIIKAPLNFTVVISCLSYLYTFGNVKTGSCDFMRRYTLELFLSQASV